MDLRRLRVKLLVDIWGTIAISEKMPSREEIMNLLEEKYKEYKIEPIRGAVRPPDIFDKEMISLYIVGKYGLGIEKDMPDIVESIFIKESQYEKALKYLLSDKDLEYIRKNIEKTLGNEPDSSILSKIFRFAFTLHYLGFEDEKIVIKALQKAFEVFPGLRDTVKRFTKFFIASKIAEAIARGRIKSWVEKEAYKQALALEIGIHKALPDDEYIKKIAEALFALTSRKLNKILSKKLNGGESIG